MYPFRRTRRGYEARLTSIERAIVARAIADVSQLFDVAAADDPALARLLPAASDDPELAAAMRDLTHSAIREAKTERLRAVWSDLQTSGSAVVVPLERAMDWAGALTDVRLVLAQRLGIEEAEDAENLEVVASTSPDEVTRAMASLYVALSWLQESLLSVMLESTPGEDV